MFVTKCAENKADKVDLASARQVGAPFWEQLVSPINLSEQTDEPQSTVLPSWPAGQWMRRLPTSP